MVFYMVQWRVQKKALLLRAVCDHQGGNGLLYRGEDKYEVLSSIPGTAPKRNTFRLEALESIFVQTSYLPSIGSFTYEPRYITSSL